MLVTPPFGASSNIALWRAYSKPPVELVVADLDILRMKSFASIASVVFSSLLFRFMVITSDIVNSPFCVDAYMI